ncbi:c-type cytochrome [Nannocystis sp. SCPEA4]|uniref:c-type cytochrome n=1 Tax=Nannocystis sp. SCPEA4 TaxID=2996787 RepID=UPI00226F8BA7|nr:c-type cytochrome [Nannocystis sp. SCPEA4]MCY1057918.1 c-type cytochrome [Nannocystis sp. SCPEA4]
MSATADSRAHDLASPSAARGGLFGHVRSAMLLAALLAGCKEPTGPEREISGAKIFTQNCARCHGHDGKGLPEVAGVRDLTDPGFMSTLSDERLRRSIRGGRPPTMPSFPHFSEPTLKVLVAYVRTLSQPELQLPPPPTPGP